MARFVFIVQGTGRGHLSQAVAMQEYLEEAGDEVVAVFTGGRPGLELPDYYLEAFRERHRSFMSPWFLTLPNKKGIYIVRTILLNLLRAPFYITETGRLRREIDRLEPDAVINFYELIGALSMRSLSPEIRRIAVGHHFLLHLEDYPCKRGNRVQKNLLSLHTRILLRSCDRVLALSFRKRKGKGKIAVVPPLVRRTFREGKWKSGPSYLVYLLQEGFITDLIRVAREDQDFSCDLFSSLPPDSEMPSGICLHLPGEKAFREKMLSCRALLGTAGFDTLAEAACMGVPVGVVPSENHFEQECNAADLERSGLGTCLQGFNAAELSRIGSSGSEAFRTWMDGAREAILKEVKG